MSPEYRQALVRVPEQQQSVRCLLARLADRSEKFREKFRIAARHPSELVPQEQDSAPAR
jgi:hypothetical protein